MLFFEPEEKTKRATCWHYSRSDAIANRELDYEIPEMVVSKDDFKEDQVFFVSTNIQTWFPSHLKDQDLGAIQLITFTFKNSIIIPDQDEYMSITVLEGKSSDYYLSDKAKELVKLGYDWIRYIGPDLEESFIVDPKKQVILIDTFNVRRDLMNAAQI